MHRRARRFAINDDFRFLASAPPKIYDGGTCARAPDRRHRKKPLTHGANNMSNKPAHKIRDGLLAVTIWENEHDGKAYYSVDLKRNYKDGDTWKETTALSGRDLLKAANLLTQAYNWIIAPQDHATDDTEESTYE